MRPRSKRANRCGMILALAASVAAAAQTTAPRPAWAPVETQPATTQASTTKPATTRPTSTPALDPEIDKILTRLEERVVHDLHARLSWRQQYVTDLEEEAATKNGEIWYQKSQPVARFLIHFTESITAGRRDKLDERHLFDGCWYVELQSRTRTLTRREVRKPEDPTDPYRLGQGPFPLPFGQKKEDVLREFEVQRIPAASDDPPATDHIRLVPRAGTQTGQSYRTLDVWISQEGPTAGLPIKVRAAKLRGTGQLDSYITITFSDARLNQGFSGSLFDIKAPPGYEVIEERLEPAGTPP